MTSPTIELWTVPNTDENLRQIVDLIALSLPTAFEAEIISPENETNLRAWLSTSRAQLRPPAPSPAQPIDLLKSSKYFEFWNTLQPEQEVRWTKTKNATYRVVTGELCSKIDSPTLLRYRGSGLFVLLRRSTGKTFYTHIAQVRPL